MTDKLRAAAKMALEAMQDIIHWYSERDENDEVLPPYNQTPEVLEAIQAVQALRQALDQLPDTTKMIEPSISIVGWMYEDQLPEIYPYEEMFPFSVVDGVRMFPVYAPKAEPDMGIDRGAWANVPDATKWVDELRGDEDLEEPPNSTTDVVEPEPIGYVYENELHGMADSENPFAEIYPYEGNGRIPVYTAPPKREWQGLTDEEIEEGYELCWVQSKQAWESAVWWAEAKLKEKNDANHV